MAIILPTKMRFCLIRSSVSYQLFIFTLSLSILFIITSFLDSIWSTIKNQSEKRSAIVDQPSMMIKKKMKFLEVSDPNPTKVIYQRFDDGFGFEAELSKFYNPTYFFLRILNQMVSYDEMHRDIKFEISIISHTF